MEYLGDTDKVLEMAKEDYDKGEYQWVAEITNTLIYADPDNTDARLLCADALEQLLPPGRAGGQYDLCHGRALTFRWSRSRPGRDRPDAPLW